MPAPLFETESNKIPEGIAADYLDLPDGKRLRHALLPAAGRPLNGTVIILHGRNECIEKYFETMQDLSARGFGTATFDWVGQGGSDRLLKDPMRGHVTDFDRYVEDLNYYFENVVLPDCRAPFYILAHSTGSLIALLASPGLTNRVRRMVLCAPLLGMTNQPLGQKQIKRLSGFLTMIGLGSMYMSGGPRPRETLPFEDNRLTSDPVRYKRNSRLFEEHRHLGLGGPTARWVHASCIAGEQVQEPDFKAKIQVPTLVVAAGDDKIVSNATIERFVVGMRSTALVTVDGGRHELLQEKDYFRDQVLAAFDAFVPGSGDPML
ncbi:MAG: alpha/beta hydrolase [Rhizobiaceae bacterium]